MIDTLPAKTDWPQCNAFDVSCGVRAQGKIFLITNTWFFQIKNNYDLFYPFLPLTSPSN